MRLEFGLHDLAIEDARLGHPRPKVEEHGEAIEGHIFKPGTLRDNVKHLYELKQRMTIVKHAVTRLLDETALTRTRAPNRVWPVYADGQADSEHAMTPLISEKANDDNG